MFGRTAVWQDCVPGGDGGAHLAYNADQAYVDGVYRFLDADGNLVETQIEWCKLVINASGLKLAIILPIGFVAALALGSAYMRWAARRADRRKMALLAEVKRARECNGEAVAASTLKRGAALEMVAAAV